MKVIPIVTVALGTIPKGLVKGLEKLGIKGQTETIQTAAFLRSARILRKVLERLAVTQTPVKDHQLITCPRKWHTQTPMGLWHTNGSPNLGQKTRPYNNQQKKKKKKKKKICKIVDFAVPANHRIKLKECEKKDKHLNLARELKKTMEHEGDNCNWCFWHSN